MMANIEGPRQLFQCVNQYYGMEGKEPMVTAQLTDVDNSSVGIGMPVEMVTRKLREDGDRGMLVYGYKFRPVLAH